AAIAPAPGAPALVAIALFLITRRVGVVTRHQLVLGLLELTVAAEPEMLDESAAPAAHAAARSVVDRQIDHAELGFARGAGERRLGRDVLGPHGLNDRLEDRQRHARAGLVVAERAALAV